MSSRPSFVNASDIPSLCHSCCRNKNKMSKVSPKKGQNRIKCHSWFTRRVYLHKRMHVREILLSKHIGSDPPPKKKKKKKRQKFAPYVAFPPAPHPPHTHTYPFREELAPEGLGAQESKQITNVVSPVKMAVNPSVSIPGLPLHGYFYEHLMNVQCFTFCL